MNRNILLLVAAVTGTCLGLVQGYSVEPKTVAWSGWTSHEAPNNRVSQLVTCCWDELDEASGGYVELFVGDIGTGVGAFGVDVYEYPNGIDRIAYSENRQPQFGHAWLRFPMATSPGQSFTKGKQYEFRFTRAGTDSINYYYQNDEAYGYGDMKVGNDIIIGRDLCMRVYGVMDAVSPRFWAVDHWQHVTWRDSDTVNIDTLRHECAVLADSAGVGTMMVYAEWMRIAQSPTVNGWNDFDAFLWDAHVAGCRPVVNIQSVSKYASSRIAMVWRGMWVPDTAHYGDSTWQEWMELDTAVYCAPRNLWQEDNLWAKYIDELVCHADANPQRRSWPGRPCDFVHVWEIWNEPNDTCIDSHTYPPFGWTTGWWRRPTEEYNTGYDGLQGLCRLYVRMAWVADSVIRSKEFPGPTHANDTVLIGATHRIFYENAVGGIASGADFIRTCYQIADDDYGGAFWDGVSLHPYQDEHGFDPAIFETMAETVRAIAREYGDLDCQVWCSEVGLLNYGDWSDPSQVQQYYQEDAVRYLPQLYSTALASQALPGARYDQCQWWFYATPLESDSYGLVGLRGYDPSTTGSGEWHKFASYYKYQQLVERLTGMQFERRVLLGDERDDSCRIYEFRDATCGDRRTWLGWTVDPNGRQWKPIDVQIPVRTDTAFVGELGTTGGALADGDGWLRLTLTPLAADVTEATTSPSRPDLVVDSVRLPPLQVQRPGTIRAYVKNVGNRATPGYLAQDSIDMQLPTWVHFYRNDVLIDSVRSNTSIAPGATRTFTLTLDPVPSWMHGMALYSARANPHQTYVERAGLDDNTGYVKGRATQAPTGELDVVVPAPGRSNLPVIGLSLSSASYEQDTTGQTPADSFRLRQVHYAFGDSIPDDSVTSAWAAFRPDTVVALAFGAGRYRIEAQYKDGAENASVWLQDTTFDLLAFNAAAPVGSLDLNSGARFATVTARTVRVSGSDAGAGLATLRLSHSPGANLLGNPAFGTDAGWTFRGGATYDGGLGLAVLPVASGAVAAVSQPVAAARLSPLIGDSLRLGCDLLVSVDSACSTAVGSISLFYRYRYLPDTLQPDSLLPVAAAYFEEGRYSLCALSPLGADFLLPAPGSGAQWQWQGGLVKLSTFGAAGLSGTVWADNLRLAPCGPAADYGWDAPFDSLLLWTIAGSPGPHPVWGLLTDSCGNESAVFADTVVLDTTPPTADIYQPLPGSKVNKTVKLAGLGFDPVEVAGDTWFLCYRLDYRQKDSTEYLPVVPDSVSYAPCYAAGPGLPGALGDWNTLLVPDGQYYVRLTVCDSAGHESEDEVWVTVQNGTVTPKSMAAGPAGAVSLDAEGADYTGSAQGRIVRIGEDLDSLGGFVFADSGTPAYVAAVIELDSGHLLCADLRTGDLSRLAKDGSDQEKLIEGLGLPVDLALDEQGNVWTLDRGSSRLYCHQPDGTQLRELGGQGTGPASLNYPEAVTVRAGLVYVADTRNDRIAVYDTAGTLDRLIAGDFEDPGAIVVTADGAIYVIDKQTGTIEGINQLGGHIFTIEPEDAGQFRGLGLASNGRDLVTLIPGPGDIASYEVQSPDSLPDGVQSNRSLKLPLRAVLYQPRPNPMRDRLIIRYGIPREEKAGLRVYDATGRLCRTLLDGQSKPGWYTAVWDRTDNHGRTVASGVYFVKLETGTGTSERKKVILAR